MCFINYQKLSIFFFLYIVFNIISAVYDHDGNEKTPLYATNDNEKTVLKCIVGFCMVFCIGLLIILLIHIQYGSHQVC